MLLISFTHMEDIIQPTSIMLDSTPLLSILIATKNRSRYCKVVIDTILKFDNQNFELVVQDNSDDLDLCDYVKNIKDERLVYRYTPPPLSSIGNFNLAIELSRGKYLTLIGDDDIVTDAIFDYVEWANSENIDSLTPKAFYDYCWPSAFYEGSEGYLIIPRFNEKKCTFFDPKLRINSLLKSGIVNYMKFDLPKLYHGVVKRVMLEKIKNLNSGVYLGGLSPDIFAAVSLSFVVNKHCVIEKPLTIAGACNKSTTIAGLKGTHSGRIEDAPHLRSIDNYVWDNLVPQYYSVQTIWAESAIKAIRLFNNEVKFNSARMVASSIINSPSFFKLFLKASVTNKHSSFLRILYILRIGFYLFLFLINKIFTVVCKIFDKIVGLKPSKIDNIESIEIAFNLLNKK